MSRDWQKDMELLNQCGDSYMPYKETEFSVMLPYWLQQYAQLQSDFNYITSVKDSHKKRLEEWGNRALESEAREQKLREVIEEAMEEEWRSVGEQTPVYIILCQSLYPREKTKPAVLEEEETHE